MRRFMNLLETRIDYQPSQRLQAFELKFEQLRKQVEAEAHGEIMKLFRAMKRLYPETTFGYRDGMGSRSIIFSPPLEIEGQEYEIDRLIGEVETSEWRVVQGDERAQTVLGHCEHVFQLANHIDQIMGAIVDEVRL